MTSRERVLKAVNFEKPDRVPIDLNSMRASGINVVIYDQLKKRMGIDTPTKVWDTMEMLGQLEPEVADRLGVDVLPMDTHNAVWARQNATEGVKRKLFAGTDVYFRPDEIITVEPDGGWTLRNKAGDAYATMPKDGYYFDFLRPTMATTGIDPAKFKPVTTLSDEHLRNVEDYAADLYNNTDKALLGWGASISMMGLSALLSDNITQGSLDDWLCMLMVEKDTANDMMARYVDATISLLKLYNQAVGDRCFAWGVASDDAGTQKGVLIAPDLFKEMIQPHYKRLCDWVHTNTPWKTYLHSCGSIYEYIEPWIDAGIDILNPVQISAANMEPQRLMNDFGGRICFWGGGCDTQKVLPLGTPDEVRQHVVANLEAFDALNGGFVFTQVHNIQQDVPVENVEAMFQAALNYRQA